MNWKPRKGHLRVNGAKLTAARIKARMSMDEVASQLGCNKSSVSRWEQETLNPTKVRVGQLVEMYGTDKFVEKKGSGK